MTVGQLRQQGDFGVAGLGDDERGSHCDDLLGFLNLSAVSIPEAGPVAQAPGRSGTNVYLAPASLGSTRFAHWPERAASHSLEHCRNVLMHASLRPQ